MKTIYIDTETTGTDPQQHGIIALSGVLEADGRAIEFDYKIRPLPVDKLDPKALAVNGLNAEELTKFPESRAVYREFLALLGRHVDKFDKKDKLVWVGYNARFDMDFVRAWFGKLGDVYFGSWFWFPPIDAMGLAMWRLRIERAKLPDFKLRTVAGHLGLALDETRLHESLYDIQLTRDLLAKLNF